MNNTKTKRPKKEIIISDNRDFKGVWVPERLYLTREFTPNEKFLLIEIYSLTKNKSRKCFASNKHFADFVGLKENTIQKMMLKFENAGYIKRIYEYKENSKEIDKRIVILTDKFYESFINEKETPIESSETPMEKNQRGYGFESMGCDGEKTIGDMDKKSEISNIYLSDTFYLSKTSLSDTSKGQEEKKGRNNSENCKAETSVPEKQKHAHKRSKYETYIELKEKEKDMLNRTYDICRKEHSLSEDISLEVVKIIDYYLSKYTQKTGNIHPILGDRALSDIISVFCDVQDTEYGHFENLVEDDGYMDIIDEFFKTDFGQRTGERTDYHLSHFATDGVISRLAQRLV